MRGAVDHLGTRLAIIAQLPTIYQDDEFSRQFTGGLDQVMAPVISTLDCLDAYLDPFLCPPDFLEWLAGWMGLALEDDWSLDRRRWLVASAIPLYRLRGTPAGLRAELEIYTGGDVEVDDSGGTTWSPAPRAPVPGDAVPRVRVRVAVDDPEALNVGALHAIVTAAKPAHAVHEIEVVSRGQP